MKTEFRNRAFLPVMIPLAILVVLAAVVGLFALILLYNTRETAVMVAIVAAAGVLTAIALAASKDRLDLPQKGAVAFAGLIPVVLGGLVAVGAIGDVADEDRMINVEPHGPEFLLASVPEGAPTLGATSLNSFCEIQDDGSCVDTTTWDIDEAVAEEWTYAFDNRDTATGPHNLVIFEYAGESPDDPQAGEQGALLTPTVPEAFDGPETRAYNFAWPEGTGPESFYFLCTIHPNTMYGVGTFTG